MYAVVVCCRSSKHFSRLYLCCIKAVFCLVFVWFITRGCITTSQSQNTGTYRILKRERGKGKCNRVRKRVQRGEIQLFGDIGVMLVCNVYVCYSSVSYNIFSHPCIIIATFSAFIHILKLFKHFHDQQALGFLGK